MKKTYKFIILSMLFCLASSATAFAYVQNGSLIIGNTAYSLRYANDKNNQDKIRKAIVNSNSKVYIKGFDGSIIDNSTNKIVKNFDDSKIQSTDSNGNILPKVIHWPFDEPVSKNNSI